MNKQIELSPRLRAVADYVPAGARLADVGTDHAYLPAALILEGKIPSAIAADLREGPLNRARQTAAEHSVTENIVFRLCDGLTGIAPDEADAIAIAGMGGETIADILAAAPWTRTRGIPLILQPMSSMSDLRGWLQKNGYRICEEKLVQEGDTLYTVLSVCDGDMDELTAAELCVGKNSHDPLRGEWLDRWIAKTRRALDGLSKARQEGSEARRTQLEETLDGLERMKEEWLAWQQ